MTETTLTLGETAWIGEGPEYTDVHPLIFAPVYVRFFERYPNLATHGAAEMLTDSGNGCMARDWREMQEVDE